MTIDFESKDGRQNYLNEKLDNLLSGINASYGQVLLDELVTRLQRTLADFNEEVEGIMGDLKESSDRRNQIIHDLMEGNETAYPFPRPMINHAGFDFSFSGLKTAVMLTFQSEQKKGLNKKKFIVPGLGDAGDRYMGT